MTREDEPARAEDTLERAQALLMERQLVASLAAYRRAEMLGADLDACAGGLWQALMLMGDMEGAWKESDAIRERGGPDPHRFWDGTSVRAKTVMVRCLHGFGDTIQMLRYMPGLREVAEHVVLEVPPRLLPLMRALSLATDERLEIITWEQQSMAAAPAWEMQIEVMELPYIFRTCENDLPISAGYVRLPEEEVRRVGDGMGVRTDVQVGLVWTAGEWNQERAIDPVLLQPLLKNRATFWSLVHGSHRHGMRSVGTEGNLRDAEMFGEGILPMAAVVANLDLVITTDTLAAHLAGAMERPVWVLLPYAGYWRWMSDPERSAWYPSMRLFRQSSPGDWGGVVARVDGALQDWLAKGSL